MAVIRTASLLDAPAIARVHARSWKDAYRGILDPAYLANLTEARLVPRWRTALVNLEVDHDEAIFVAEVDGKVAGFVCAGACRETPALWDGEVSMIYVLSADRKSGLGRALMKAAAAHCIRRGLFTVGLWVLESNAAGRNFYQRLGGMETGRKSDTVGGKLVRLRGYGWEDIGRLAQLTPSQAPSKGA
jgi:ribosomal protein S18 acetylase RimI-like enzyme